MPSTDNVGPDSSRLPYLQPPSESFYHKRVNVAGAETHQPERIPVSIVQHNGTIDDRLPSDEFPDQGGLIAPEVDYKGDVYAYDPTSGKRELQLGGNLN